MRSDFPNRQDDIGGQFQFYPKFFKVRHKSFLKADQENVRPSPQQTLFTTKPACIVIADMTDAAHGIFGGGAFIRMA